MVEFASAEEAKEGRARLVASGVLNRFADKTESVVIEESDAVRY